MNLPQPQPTVTLKDIARKLGLSHGSVSKALRDDPEISETTRERVQVAAREMGYQPNPMGAGLAEFKRRSKIVPVRAALAWVNFWPDPRKLRTYGEFDRYWLGACACAEKFGYRLEEFVYNDLHPMTRLKNILDARGINGLLIPPGPLPDDITDLEFDSFSIIGLSRSRKSMPINAVTSDQLANTMLAFHKTSEKGYRRIGFIGSDWEDRLFEPGYHWAQRDLPPDRRLPPLYFHDDYAANERALAAWIHEYRPDAIITERGEVMKMLNTAKLRVPEDIGIAALTVLDCPIDAGIYQNPEEIGRVAVLGLLSLIYDNAHGIPPIQREILIKGKWVDGASLPLRHQSVIL